MRQGLPDIGAGGAVTRSVFSCFSAYILVCRSHQSFLYPYISNGWQSYKIKIEIWMNHRDWNVRLRVLAACQNLLLHGWGKLKFYAEMVKW
jgi:hypothetical protein